MSAHACGCHGGLAASHVATPSQRHPAGALAASPHNTAPASAPSQLRLMSAPCLPPAAFSLSPLLGVAGRGLPYSNTTSTLPVQAGVTVTFTPFDIPLQYSVSNS
jgi:hypothetical protein